MRWLNGHADLDGDGHAGWGLPDAWDAFGDGSVNPPNHPYTISAALVAEGILDALAADRRRPSLLGREVTSASRRVLKEVWLRWSRQVWTATDAGGFFWYSPSSHDAYFVPNVSSMWAGVGARLIAEPWVRGPFARDVSQKTRDAGRALVAAVEYRNGLPFWRYVQGPHDLGTDYPNDLVHHVYILLGLERLRSTGVVTIPWQRSEAIATLQTFFRDNKLWAYPQDVGYAGSETFGDDPPRLWCVGAAMAFLGEFDEAGPLKDAFTRVLESDFAPIGRPPLYPTYVEDDAYRVAGYFPRFGTHVLWGLASILW